MHFCFRGRSRGPIVVLQTLTDRQGDHLELLRHQLPDHGKREQQTFSTAELGVDIDPQLTAKVEHNLYISVSHAFHSAHSRLSATSLSMILVCVGFPIYTMQSAL